MHKIPFNKHVIDCVYHVIFVTRLSCMFDVFVFSINRVLQAFGLKDIKEKWWGIDRIGCSFLVRKWRQLLKGRGCLHCKQIYTQGKCVRNPLHCTQQITRVIRSPLLVLLYASYVKLECGTIRGRDSHSLWDKVLGDSTGDHRRHRVADYDDMAEVSHFTAQTLRI